MNRTALASFLILILALTGCATGGYTALTTSGESLKGVGEQFVAVSAIYVQGCNTGQIVPRDCANYRTFGEKFKKSYPLAIALWDAARNAGDAAAEKKTREVITGLATELSALTISAYAVFAPTGGN